MKQAIIRNREKFKESDMFNTDQFNSLRLKNFIVNACVIKGDEEYNCNLSLNTNRWGNERIKVLDKNFFYIPDKPKNVSSNFKGIVKKIRVNESIKVDYIIKIINPITQKIIYEKNVIFWELSLVEPRKQKEIFAQLFFRLYIYDNPNEELKKLRSH